MMVYGRNSLEDALLDLTEGLSFEEIKAATALPSQRVHEILRIVTSIRASVVSRNRRHWSSPSLPEHSSLDLHR